MNQLKFSVLTTLLMSLLITWPVTYAQTNSQPPSAITHHLMPVPAKLNFQDGRLSIYPAFKIAVTGYTDGRLLRGIDRAARRLEARTGLEFVRALAPDEASATLVIRTQAAGLAVPGFEENESYTLNVTDKQAVLNAPTVIGVLRGLETFLQLVEGDREGYYLPAVQIDDQPRFPWRGLLIDVCRHWQPMDVIKRNLDGMAAVKLNVLHWHLTEDQGFRIESKRYPKLHEMGSDGLYYTQEQAREIIEYARDRGIRVIPEFDMPGHTTSWFVGHPELASAPGPYQIERKYGVMNPTIDPTREETYKFLDGFLGEMAALFPDAYLHIGGDENNGRQWKANPQIQSFMQAKNIKDAHQLQAYFNQRISKILTRHGKKMIGWDEVLHPDLPQTIVVQSWRGQESLAESARKGYQTILSNGYYLDLIQPTDSHYKVDPIPPDSGLTDQEKARILGGEACMWTEYASPETIDSRIWPRLAAVAERLWSPQSVTDVADMYRRLAVVSIRLEESGLMHDAARGRQLRRLAGSNNIRSLETLLEVVEPVKFYKRGGLHATTQMTPLTRLVDTARPDADARRTISAMVDDVLQDAPRFKAFGSDYAPPLARVFTEWRNLRPALDVVADQSPIVREAVPLAADLSEIGGAGLEALSYLSQRVAPPAGWRESKLALLERAAKPRAEVEFIMLPALRKLIIAAAEVDGLKNMTPEEWNKRVTEMAGPTEEKKE